VVDCSDALLGTVEVMVVDYMYFGIVHTHVHKS